MGMTLIWKYTLVFSFLNLKGAAFVRKDLLQGEQILEYCLLEAIYMEAKSDVRMNIPLKRVH